MPLVELQKYLMLRRSEPRTANNAKTNAIVNDDPFAINNNTVTQIVNADCDKQQMAEHRMASHVPFPVRHRVHKP